MPVIVKQKRACQRHAHFNMENKEYQTRARSAKQILEMDIKEYPTLLEGIIPMKGIAALAGSSDLGKSYLLQQLSVAVASGADEFIGFKLNIKKQGALYISTEDDDFAMNLRLNKLEKFGNPDGMMNLNFIFDPQNLVNTIEQELEIKPVSLVVIDAFADVFRGSLNDTISVRQFMEPFKLIAQKHECAIVFNHHCGKHNQYKLPSKDNLLGSQGFESSMRTVMELRQDLNDETKRHLCIVKGNNMPTENKNRSFELIFDFENGFSNTGNRCKYENLILNKFSNSRSDLEDKIFELRRAGKSSREISLSLKENDNISVGKSKVADVIKRRLINAIDSDIKSEIKKD